VPPDIIAELRSLQDDVRPFPFADVERTIIEELGQPVERLFTEFEEEPLARLRSARYTAQHSRTASGSP